MKKFFYGMPVVVTLLLAGCLHPVGSVSEEAVQEMLASPHLAVTPYQPAWLNENGEGIWPLSEADRRKVCAILQSGEARDVPELAYQTDDEHAPLVQHRFYIYAPNGQCLAGTLLDKRVVMHDVVLPEEQEKELYTILKPYLRKVFSKAS